MTVDWIGEFFSTLPDIARALWTTNRGWAGLWVSLGSIGIFAGFALAARQLRDTQGWLSALFGMMSATVAVFWLLAILPSAWVYFADGQKDLMENTVIPGSLAIGDAVIATNFYQVVRDTVVVIETGIAVGLLTVAALYVQKKYPRSLAEGEEARPQSGGYK